MSRVEEMTSRSYLSDLLWARRVGNTSPWIDWDSWECPLNSISKRCLEVASDTSNINTDNLY